MIPSLLETLKREGSGILNIWMLAGLRDCLRSGLQIPEKIKAATAAYREEQDILGDWIAENCDTGLAVRCRRRSSTPTTFRGRTVTVTDHFRSRG